MDTITNIEIGPIVTTLVSLLASSLISSAVVSLIVGSLLKRRTEEITASVRNEFEIALHKERSRLEWEKESLAKLLGPMVMQLDRTRRAIGRYNANNLFIEAKVLKAGNETVRDLLLGNGHLVPFDLRGHAQELIEHFDCWLEEFDRVRGGAEPMPNEPFVFAGPKGSPFPREAERRFIERFEEMVKTAYGKSERA